MNKIYLFLLAAIFLIGCQTELETYESKRPKTADMQDAMMVELKNEQMTESPEIEDSTEQIDTEVTESESSETEPVTEEVTEAATESTEPAEETEAEPEVTESFESTSEYPQTISLTDNLNFRDGPGTDYQILATLTAGDSIEVIGLVMGEGGTWYRVTYNGMSGYVDSEALGMASDFVN